MQCVHFFPAAVGGFMATANIVGRLMSLVNNIPAVRSEPLSTQLHVVLSIYTFDAQLILNVLLLLEPLIAALLILFVGIQLRMRRFAWMVGLLQIGLWGFVLVLMFATSYAAVHAPHWTWIVDSHAQGTLRFSQALYFSYQIFLSFSFGDIVPSLALVHGHVVQIADFVTRTIQLEAVVGHVFWVGVVSGCASCL